MVAPSLSSQDRTSEPTDGLVSEFVRWATQEPERIALEVGDASYSYGELARRALGVAEALHAQGEASTPLVGVLAWRSVSAYSAILGALLASRGYVPLNPSFPVARNRSILE